MKQAWRAGAAAAALGLVVGACTNSYLYDPRTYAVTPPDSTITLEGQFCTPRSDEVVRPIKILLAMDASQSMRVTDPDGSRALATIELIRNLPRDPEISIQVMIFAGSTTAFLVGDAQARMTGDFRRIIDITDAELVRLEQTILNFAAPGGMANRDATDFEKPLADIYALINRDIANTRLRMRGSDTRARYSVIFLSDGQPTFNQDDVLLCGDAVRRIRQLKDLADDVRVNTVHVFRPSQPVDSSLCMFSNGNSSGGGGAACLEAIPELPPGACPLLIVTQNAERLRRMAQLGGGVFRDFRNNEPINFLNFRFGQVRRTFVFGTLNASNLSSPPASVDGGADTDSDGLTDAAEAAEGTDPFVKDTDGDGFSDGVEVWARARGAPFNPRNMGLPDGGNLDPGCPTEQRGADSDCDGMADCDEQVVGSNADRPDTDEDGVTDFVEWQLGTQSANRDLDQDPDNDGLTNGEELQLHTDPLQVDSANLTVDGYRYQVVRLVDTDGGLDAGPGQECYRFQVSNIALAPTLPDLRHGYFEDGGFVALELDGGLLLGPDGGRADPRLLPDGGLRRGAGYNEVVLTFSAVPGDDPTGRSIVRTFRTTVPRYPVGGIRSPPDGVIRVTDADLVEGCRSAGQVP